MKTSYYLLYTFIFLFVHFKKHINVPEYHQSTDFEITSVSKASELTSLGQLRLSLYESNALANNETAADGVLIFFDTDGSNDVDINDAPDITNLDENFSINNNGVLLSIETRAAPVDQEEIQLEVNTYRNTNYTIVAEGISMQNAIATLYDNYEDVSTEIPQNGIINYAYTIDLGIPQSIAGDRFKIIFEVETLSGYNISLEDVFMHPNPTDLGKFYVNVPSGVNNLDISIYNILGSKLYSGYGFKGGRTIMINTDILSAGTYFVEFKSQGKTMIRKLIVI
ncbi:T9SS type A sorting domain-containing protein [Winogradskyella algicola]|uniref:T9SS type A sorting domain-containing protein n=1 Tax=Winogradskyella algicola TaxID=2575815 RepID=UPI001107EF1D|nr:T9SS type A sorting domain-containing protein [Winogradskyella algicola]